MRKNGYVPSGSVFIYLAICCVGSGLIGLGVGGLIAKPEYSLPKFTEAKVSKIIEPSDRPVHQIECTVRCDADECKLAYRLTKGVL